jgi:Fe-S oxidoreductase
VEMCSGVGACRKKLSGTMCPSYMATREESASTRGRANVLRLAMTGKLEESGLGDDGVMGALDLCLECRACKAECPVGVDVARFKSEFLSDYYTRHGVPPKARALGNVHRAAVWGSRLAPLSNRLAASRPARWLNEKLLDIDQRRTLPAWRSDTFARWARNRSLAVAARNGTSTDENTPRRPEFRPNPEPLPSDQQGRWPCQTGKELARLPGQIWPKTRLEDFLCYQSFGCQFFGSRDCEGAVTPRSAAVTLFNDTFTNHYDPEIGIAAVEVLERGGCTVNVVRPGCCGRPLISQGLLSDARAHAARLITALHPIASRGEPILFCEPSCLSAVKDDAIGLLRDELQQKARDVAQVCQLFDEFAACLELPLRPAPGRILLHGHCHQKSLGLLPASIALLSRIPGAQVVDLDAGCCGMAGSFGYTRGHYDVSVAIAERRLLPAVRKMKPGDTLVATGTSCRHQVAELEGTKAVHPAVFIRDLLS